jgi:hypothetical protein
MLFLSIMHHYLLWHYTRGFTELFHVWMNFLWFIVNFFSIPQLLRSWISPWKRMVEDRGNTWNIEDLASFVIIGIISRIVGFIMRTVVILLGFTSLILTAILGFITYAFWVIAPLVIIGLLGFGIALFISDFNLV